MARIAGIELQDNWKVDYALTNIKGIGWPLARKILVSTKVNVAKRISDLDPNEISKITSALEEYSIEGELVRQIRTNITRLKNINSYRGTRHSRGLPVRGQKTRRNARTKRGKRKTIGAFKKEAITKQQPQKTKKDGE